MPAGAPLKFQSIEGLQAQIDAYFMACDFGITVEVYDKKKQALVTTRRPIPYTITGLALSLGTSRQTLINYEQRDEYYDTIKTAKLKCENYAELRLMTGDIHPSGAIFALKNYGWTDKQELEHGSNPNKPMKWEIEIIKSDAKNSNT